jgi:DNA-binding CsgD family transcriptional regulator
MGRLLPFLELAAVSVIVYFAVSGGVPAGIAVAPLLIVVSCPLLAACAVWPPGRIRRAFADGWGSDPLRRAQPESAAIWRFMERMAPLAGILGAGTFAVLALAGPAVLLGKTAALAGVGAGEATGAFLLFRAVRTTVDLLARRDASVLPRELTTAAGDLFRLSPREREVAALLTQGLQYSEIADQLFISIKTVKTHVHRLYEKTETRNRMELANRLRA